MMCVRLGNTGKTSAVGQLAPVMTSMMVIVASKTDRVRRMFDSTWDSVSTRRLPQWFDDAKLGVFLHWGLYSVPAWAPRVSNIQQLLRDKGPSGMFRSNPYAEWYLNTMQIRDSPTQVHHRTTYGADYPYDRLVKPFDDASGSADLDALAALCKQGGAQYVVLTTKHHEGFTLWPSSLEHPKKGRYHAQRDLVGDLSEAVRLQGMRMGLYYSGGYDWPFNDAVLKGAADTILAMPSDPAYRDYAVGHVRELIDRYQPSVLWNDIGWPGGGNLAELFAYYYNTAEDGVVNDRWKESSMRRDRATEFAVRAGGEAAQRLWRFIPESKKELAFAGAKHFDFTTPEYATLDHIAPRKWEATRGIGHSFGANHNERPEDIVTTTELVRSFCDIVSKNGNLLIGIGPGADGSISEEQQIPLRGLGTWLAANSEAIFGSRPWQTAEGVTSEGTAVRYTQREDAVYAMLTDTPGVAQFSLRNVDATGITDVRLLGIDGDSGQIAHTVNEQGVLTIQLPASLPVSAAHVLRISPASGIRSRA